MTDKDSMARILALTLVLMLAYSCSYMKGSESFLGKLSRSLASIEALDSQMASIRSIVNEINTNGKKIAHLYMYPKPKLSNFDSNERVKTLLAKMKVAQKELLLQTSINDINSADGQKVLLMVVDYLQAVVTVNKIYAQIAHLPLVNGAPNFTSNYDWKTLDQYNLKLDKDYALMLLSKINFLSKHMSDQEVTALGLTLAQAPKAVEIKLGGEIRHLLEHLAVSDPTTVDGYGLLIKFNALKETMINAWAINRLYKDPYKGNAISSATTKDLLTFRPGEDKTLATADYYEELMQSDNYYNVFSLEIQKVVDAAKSSKTVSMSIATDAEYEELYHNLIWGHPLDVTNKTVKPFQHLRDYYLGYGKYAGFSPYTKADVTMRYPGAEVRETEEYDFTGDPPGTKETKTRPINYGKYPHLYYSVFAGDDLTAENVSSRMAKDAYQFRSEAIIQLMAYRIIDQEFSEADKVKLKAHLRTLIDTRFKARYLNHFTSITKPMLDKHLANSSLVQRKVNDKYTSLKKALTATEGIKSTFVMYYIDELDKLPKTATLHPRTPEILVAMIKDALEKGYHDDLIFSLEDETIGAVVKQFYTDVSNAFYKAVKGTESFDQMSMILWNKLNEVAYIYHKKYPYTFQEEMMYDMRKENVMVQDNTYVDPRVKYIVVDKSKMGNVGQGASKAKTTGQKKVDTKKQDPKPLTFDDKLQNLMLTFQPFVQGQDLSTMKNQGKGMKNVEFIDVRREQYKAKQILPTPNITLYKLFRLIGLNTTGFQNASTAKTPSYYNAQAWRQMSVGIIRQRFLAEQNIALLKMSAPLVQNVIFYQTLKHSHIQARSETTTYTYEDVYKPAIFVMAMKAYNEVTDAVDQKIVGQYIGEAMTASRQALKGQAHADSPATPFKEGLFETFAQADTTDPKNNTRFQFMYDQLEELRGIIMHANGNHNQSSKFQKFDQYLFATIHPYKYMYEKYIAPVINIVIAIIMVVSIIVGFIFPPAAIPGWLAASLLVFEVSAFTYMMADNIGYRIIYQRMYEIPATLKMQGHLAAISSVGESPLQLMYKKGAEDEAKIYKINSSLDSWDRISAAEKANIEERKSLIYERLMWLPLDLMWGASIVKQFRTFTGLSGIKAAKQMGIPVLTFRQKVQMVFKTNNWETVFKEKGLIRGVGTVSKDIVTGIPQMGKLLPKYQPHAKILLEKQTALRIGLHNKFVEIYESGKFVKEFDAIGVSTAKYALEGENLVLHQLFKEVKAFDTKTFSQFIERGSTSEINKLLEKIQASLDKGITPLEMEVANAFAHTPKTLWGVFFSGVFEKSRINKLKSVLKPGIEPAEALTKFREAQATNNAAAVTKVFDEVTIPGQSEELLMQVFGQAGLKTSLTNTVKTIKNNISVWKTLKQPEVVLTNDMLKLRNELKNAKHIRAQALSEKAKSVEELLEKNPEFYKEMNYSSVNEYWWAILDHSDLMLIEEISRSAIKGSVVRQFSLVFVDHRALVESIRPLEWKVANDSRAIRPVGEEPTFKADFEDTVVDDANFYPTDGFGDKKSQTILLLESKIDNQLQ